MLAITRFITKCIMADATQLYRKEMHDNSFKHCHTENVSDARLSSIHAGITLNVQRGRFCHKRRQRFVCKQHCCSVCILSVLNDVCQVA